MCGGALVGNTYSSRCPSSACDAVKICREGLQYTKSEMCVGDVVFFVTLESFVPMLACSGKAGRCRSLSSEEGATRFCPQARLYRTSAGIDGRR
jgi:hypothetical protein